MKKFALAALVAISLTSVVANRTLSDDNPKRLYSHDVYFELKDKSPEVKKAFVAACKKYLSKHPGTVFYAAGERADRSGNVYDREFDIALHIVFDSKESCDRYAASADHKQFVGENLKHMAKVRVFDANVEQ